MTLIGWIFVLVLFGFVVLVGLKLFPVYLDSFKVSAALDSVVKSSDIAELSKAKIQEAIAKRLDIDDVDRFLGIPFKDYGKIDKKGNSVTITYDYQFKAHIMGNVSVVVDFVKTAHN